MNDLNRELANVLGVDFDWQRYITVVTFGSATKFARNGVFDDIVTDVVSDLYLAAKDGKLAGALVKAKKKSNTPDELLHNVKGVVHQATKFRASDARRKWTKHFATSQFSQLEKEVTAMVDSVPDRTQTDASEYVPLIVNELELMSQRVKGKRGLAPEQATKIAKRLRLAAAIVPDKLEGWGFDALMERHGVKSSSTMTTIMDDIGQAVARVAGRLQDPTLLKGTAGVLVG